MPGRRARELCPALIFIGGHFEEYQRLGDAAIHVLGDFTPLVERISGQSRYRSWTSVPEAPAIPSPWLRSPCPLARSLRQTWRTSMGNSLYERLGGAGGIAALVDDIVEAHMANPLIKARFLPYREQADTLAKVKQHTCDFFGAGSGGPEVYSGRSMRDTHRGMNISEQEYEAVADDIMSTLKKHKIDEETRKEVMTIVDSLKTDIIRV
jgi:hemoglobin